MIAHIVLFRPRPDLSVEERESLATAFLEALNKIPSIRRARVGMRIMTGRPYERLMRSDYPYAAVLEFDDRAGLMAYLEHPAHDDLGSRVYSAFADALMYDFELQEGQAAATYTQKRSP